MLRSNMSCELWWTSGSRSGGHKAGAKGEFGVRVVVLRVIATEGQREVRRVPAVCQVSEFCQLLSYWSAGRGWRGGGRNCQGSEAREVEWTHAQNQKQKQLLVTRIPNLDNQDKNKI